MHMFGFFQPPSEEEQQQLKEAFERHRMSMEEFNHSFQRLFEELGEDQLKTLRTAFNIILSNDQSIIAGQWDAMASWELRKRFNICVTCGVNHDEELISSHGEQPDPEPQWIKDIQPMADPRIVQDGLPMFQPLSDEERSLADKYHLDDLRNEDTGELMGFVCTGINGMKGPCGVIYPSIEDRMLREPEHCSGCFSRMAQG